MMWGTLRRWLRRLRSHDLVRDYQGSNIESDENRAAKRPGCQSRKNFEFEAFNTVGAPKEKDNGFGMFNQAPNNTIIPLILTSRDYFKLLSEC